MHRRGDISTPGGGTRTRGSVWIEQEIAIAAFMGEVLDRRVPTLFYKQEGVSLEGVRQFLLMNPLVEFADESEVLEHLKSALPLTTFSPFSEYDVEPIVTHVKDHGDYTTHDHRLFVDVKNVGKKKVNDFELRVHFPRRFLAPHSSSLELHDEYSSPSHACYIVNHKKRAPDGLYPGDALRSPLQIHYIVNSALYHDRDAMGSMIHIELFSDSMPAKKLGLPIKKYQDF